MTEIKTIRVGPVLYKIEDVSGLMGTDAEGNAIGLLGAHDYANKVLQVEATVPKEYRPITLLHEAIHAILSQAGHMVHPEGQVRAIAFGMADLIRDNPEFVETIAAMGKEEGHNESD